MTTVSAWNPPPAPERDLWWQALRIAAPDTTDHTARHRRGAVRLPYTLDPDIGHTAGALVEAWVCCDPACGGVELGEHVLEINHSCCVPRRTCRPCAGRGEPCSERHRPRRRHMAGAGRIGHPGWFHGPFTAWWEPVDLFAVGGAR